jgi:hypothetical protein
MATKPPQLPKLTSAVEFAGGQVFDCPITNDLAATRYLEAARAAFVSKDLQSAQFLVNAALVHALLSLSASYNPE